MQREGRQALEGLSRLGIGARGLVWLVLSFLAAQVALGDSGAQADQQGALRTLSDSPLGTTLLAVLTVGFLGYALALALQAVEGRETSDRLKAAGKAGLYLLLALASGRFVLGGGGGGGGGGQDPQPLTARLLSAPFGRVLVALVGLAVVGVGVLFAVRAVRRTHEKRIQKWGLAGATDAAVRRVGVAGHLGRALVVLLLGAFVCLAALRADASEAKGLDEALQSLAGEAYGPVVLFAVVLGALAYALWSFAEAYLHRPGSA